MTDMTCLLDLIIIF